MENVGFAAVKSLLQVSWENWARASENLCHLLDESFLSCRDVDVHEMRPHVSTGMLTGMNPAGLFFVFIDYFASELTSRCVGGASVSVVADDVSTDTSSTANDTGATNPHGLDMAAHQMQLKKQKERPLLFPPIHTLCRQPSLIEAIESLAESLWCTQAVLHSGDHDGDCPQLVRCPLCYAASIEHVVGTKALWSLLEFHAAYRIALKPPCGDSEDMSSNRNVVLVREGDYEAVLKLDDTTQCLLWTHAIAVCRNAVWNGAVQTARLCVGRWLYTGSHSVLFARRRHHEGGLGAVQVGSDIYSFRVFLLIQSCLLIEDEVALELDTANATRSLTNNNNNNRSSQKKRCDTGAESMTDGVYNYHGDDGNEDDVASQQSSFTLRGRGDEELCASLLVLREMARMFAHDVVFVALTMTAPHHATGGVPLLHWVCERGYESCVRLLLTAWLAAYRDERIQPNAKYTQAVSEKVVCIDFKQETQGTEQFLEKKTMSKANSKAIRCTALCVGNGVLSHAVRGGNASIVRQLLLFGASRHQWGGDGEPTNEDMPTLLRNLDILTNGVTGTLHECVRGALCATSAADALANAAWRLWREKVRMLTTENAKDSELTHYRRLHDTVMRTTLAALEFDPHNIVARTTLRDVLVRKLLDGCTLLTATSETSMREKRYYMTARRMCEQLLTTHTEQEREIRSLLRTTPHVSVESTETAKAAALLSSFSLLLGAGGVGGDDRSSATIVTDEKQKLMYALVNLTNSPEGATSANASAAMTGHPLWVQLPRGVDVQRSLERAGGLYGVVESAMPLVAPVESGDLVMFVRRKGSFCFDVTRVVRLREGVVVEVPCVLQDGDGEVTRRVLRCAMVPSPVHDRVASDPLQWMEATSTREGDAVEQILNSPQHLQRWLNIAHFGCRALWFHDVALTPYVWRLCTSGDGATRTRRVVAAAAFLFACDADAEAVDDPLGVTSEALFLLQSREATAEEGGATACVTGVLPPWGWNRAPR